jgi:hypothetical protein
VERRYRATAIKESQMGKHFIVVFMSYKKKKRIPKENTKSLTISQLTEAIYKK